MESAWADVAGLGAGNAYDFSSLDEERPSATAVEYTLITSLIAVAAIASIRSLTDKVSHVLGAAGQLNRKSTACRLW